MRHSNAPQNAAVDLDRRSTKTEAQYYCWERQFTNSCTVPSRGAWGNSGESEIGEKQPRAESRAGVAHISAGVHSGYQMVRGDICLQHMHTLRSSPGEKKATCHCICWFCSPHTTNPLLILFGKKKCDATKTGARMSFSRADPAC